jgi:hypothetical protein
MILKVEQHDLHNYLFACILHLYAFLQRKSLKKKEGVVLKILDDREPDKKQFLIFSA